MLAPCITQSCIAIDDQSASVTAGKTTSEFDLLTLTSRSSEEDDTRYHGFETGHKNIGQVNPATHLHVIVG